MITINGKEYIHLCEMDQTISDAIIRGIKRVLDSLDGVVLRQLYDAFESVANELRESFNNFRASTIYNKGGICIVTDEDDKFAEISMDHGDVDLYIHYSSLVETADVLWEYSHNSYSEEELNGFLDDNIFFDKAVIDEITAKVASGVLIPR